MDDAKAGVEHPRPDRPRGAAPVRGQGPGRRRSHRAGRRRDRARGRGPDRGARGPARPRLGRALPGLGDAAARAAEPPQRHRRPSARRAAPDQAPRHRGQQRPAQGGRRADPLGAPAAGEGAGRPRAGRAGRRRRRSSSRTSYAGSSGAAYSRVDLVEKRGEFAVRGGIVDVFPPTEEHPLRVEFFGDEIDEIRSLRGRRPAHPRAGRAALGAAVPRAAAHRRRTTTRGRARRSSTRSSREITDKLAEGIAVEGMESLAPVLVDEMEMLVDLLPRGQPRARARPRAGPHPRARPGRDQRGVPRRELGRGRRRAAQAPIDLGAASLRGIGEVRSEVLEQGQAWWGVSPFGLDRRRRRRRTPRGGRAAGRGLPRRHRAGRRRHPGPPRRRPTGGHGPPGPRPGAADGRGAGGARRRRAAGRRRCRRTAPTGRRPRHPGLPRPRAALDDPGLVVLTGEDLAGQKATTRDMRKMPARRKKQIDPLELKAGDFVVHEQHGVGPLRGDEAARGARRGARVPRPRVRLLQARPPADRLYVPADALDQVTRYVGGEQPSLDRLGGADWAKRKGRARKAVRQIAAELIKLYAARQATKGHAFGPDTPWQTELEDAFPFHETPDQLSTVEEVKADMRRVVPMDRLVCGDVGYGKTEIAVRAAFKAVQDGKQVAVLVPTTLLVTQHFATFAERMSGFPVTLQPLSRFQTDKEAARGHRGPRRRQRRHRDRHPPAAQPRHQDQGPRPDHRRRGAALRRRAQGADEAAAHQRRRALHVARPRSRAPWRWRSPASARCPRSPPRPRSGTRC